MAGDMIKLGGLWTNKDKNGKTYLSGKLSPTVKILIFPNQYRESENHPTHIMYLSQVESQPAQQAEEEEGDAFSPAPVGQQGQRYQAPEDVPPLPEEEYTTVRRSQPQRTSGRLPAPPPDYDAELRSSAQQDSYDPFADEAPAPTRQPQRPGTGRNAGF